MCNICKLVKLPFLKRDSFTDVDILVEFLFLVGNSSLACTQFPEKSLLDTQTSPWISKTNNKYVVTIVFISIVPMFQKPTFGPCILCIVPAWYSVNVNRIVGTVAPCRTIRTIPGSLRANLISQSTRWTKRWFTGFIAEVSQWTGIVRVIRNAWEKNINDQCGPILVDFIFNLNSVLSYNSG